MDDFMIGDIAYRKGETLENRNVVYAELYFKKARYHFFTSAQVGNPDGANSLGLMYSVGKPGIHQNLSLAEKYLKQAASVTTYLAGKYNLGLFYHRRELYYKARIWYLEVAVSWIKEAQYNLARIYLAGKIANKGEKEAYFWLYFASKNGCIDSANVLKTYNWNISNLEMQSERAIANNFMCNNSLSQQVIINLY